MNVNARIADLLSELREKGEVTVRGFGSFRLREIPESPRYNPVTGQPYVSPPSVTVAFRPARALKESLRDDTSPTST